MAAMTSARRSLPHYAAASPTAIIIWTEMLENQKFASMHCNWWRV